MHSKGNVLISLSAVVCLGILGAPAATAAPDEAALNSPQQDVADSSDFTFEVADGEATLTDYHGDGGHVTIPAHYRTEDGTFAVTAIDSFTFHRKNLTSVDIPNTVETIGRQAFARNSLTEVAIPDSVVSLGQLAFMENDLASVDLSESLTEIPLMAFSDNELTSVTIPNGVQHIRGNAFYLNQLIDINIPDSLEAIDRLAFAYNEPLVTVDIPASVRTLGPAVFALSPNLESVRLQGDAPEIVHAQEGVHWSNNDMGSFGPPNLEQLTIYYEPNASGFEDIGYRDGYFLWQGYRFHTVPPATPTEEPTDTPTGEPAESSSPEPTETITTEPNETPSEHPSESDTTSPTEDPTASPTESLAGEPTPAPSFRETSEGNLPLVVDGSTAATQESEDSSVSSAETEQSLAETGASIAGLLTVAGGLAGAGAVLIFTMKRRRAMKP